MDTIQLYAVDCQDMKVHFIKMALKSKMTRMSGGGNNKNLLEECC